VSGDGIARTRRPEDEEAPPVLLVRLRRGVVGETQRTSHIVPAPKAGGIPDVLTAYCGMTIAPGAAELLNAPAGMPCVLCLASAPMPSHNELAKGGDDGR
jgi:hypothetical protein